jgi:2'-5' RNA ligase
MSLRLFAALDIPEAVASRLLLMQRGVDGARWSPRENLHLTLCFFGEMDRRLAEDLDLELAQEAASVRAFDLSLKGTGTFGKGDPHTLFVGVSESETLRALAADCERAARRCGIKVDGRKYTPHVTLAYLKRADLQQVAAFEGAHALFESPVWSADCFGLYSSQVRKAAPSHYRLEAEYDLVT